MHLNFLKKTLLKSYEIQFLFSSCDGCVQPSQILFIYAVWQIRLLYKNGVPLAPLRFMTGYSVGEFNL